MDELKATAPSPQRAAHDCNGRLDCVMGLLSLAAMFFPCVAVWAGGFKSLAKGLSRAAQDSGITRVAVITFEPADSSNPKDGRAIAEKLTTQLVRTGRVQTVERSLIGKLLEEHRLAMTGIIDPGTLKKLGAVLSVDGIVSGSFVTSGSRVIINARLINVETGLIVAACEEEALREWSDDPSGRAQQSVSASGYIFVAAPELTVEPPTSFMVDVPRLFPDEAASLRDSVAEDDCAQAAERVDRMEAMILELKSRYWALRLQQGLSMRSLKSNPGSTISDPELKKRFYDRMQFWYAQGSIPELTPTEAKRFLDIDQRAFALYRECGM